MTPALWKTLYEFGEDQNASNVVTVEENGRLRGYAVYFTYVRGQFRQLSVLDVCVDGEQTLSELVDRLKDRAKEEDADLIYLRKAVDPSDRIFDKKGFFSFVESIIMVALLNPSELLRALSQEISNGERLNLLIRGFDPITVEVGRNGIKTTDEAKADLIIATDSQTFLKLLFCRTSFFKEWLKGGIKLNRISKFSTANRFFSLIKQERWHIPFADWV